jgi:hypothetical protein
VAFSCDTTVNDDLIALAQGADILVHQVADLGYLERHGMTGAALERMVALHTDVTEVGGVAERARVHELILSHYLPAEPEYVLWTHIGAVGDLLPQPTPTSRPPEPPTPTGRARACPCRHVHPVAGISGFRERAARMHAGRDDT